MVLDWKKSVCYSECVQFGAAWLNLRRLLGPGGGMHSTGCYSSFLFRLLCLIFVQWENPKGFQHLGCSDSYSWHSIIREEALEQPLWQVHCHTGCAYLENWCCFQSKYWSPYNLTVSVTCWAESEAGISEHHQQQSATQEVREAQGEVSVFSVWIIPTITPCTAEPPQSDRVQPGRHRQSVWSRTTETLLLDDAHLHRRTVNTASLLFLGGGACRCPDLMLTARLRLLR